LSSSVGPATQNALDADLTAYAQRIISAVG
jgi:hypothetical protein